MCWLKYHIRRIATTANMGMISQEQQSIPQPSNLHCAISHFISKQKTNVGICTLPMASLKRDTTKKFKRWWVLQHLQRLYWILLKTLKYGYDIIFKQIFCNITNGKKVVLCKYVIRSVSIVFYITRTFWRLPMPTRLKVLNIQCFFPLFFCLDFVTFFTSFSN